MDEYHTAVACEYLPGESFLPEVRRSVKPHAHRVRLVPADFTSYQWQDGPIKLLLVDAMKTWVLGASITRSFFPSLVLGALVIHQDYKCYDTPWIPIIQFRLQDLFHFTHGVRKGCAVAFELREKIPSELIADAADSPPASCARAASQRPCASWKLPNKKASSRPREIAQHLLLIAHRPCLQQPYVIPG